MPPHLTRNANKINSDCTLNRILIITNFIFIIKSEDGHHEGLATRPEDLSSIPVIERIDSRNCPLASKGMPWRMSSININKHKRTL